MKKINFHPWLSTYRLSYQHPILIKLFTQIIPVKPPLPVNNHIDNLSKSRQKNLRVAQLQPVQPFIQRGLVTHIAMAFGHHGDQVIGEKALAFVSIIIGAHVDDIACGDRSERCTIGIIRRFVDDMQ